MIEQEEWRDVVGYEGLYLVSSLGRVKGVKRGKVLNPAVTDKGYLFVGLSKEGVVRPVRVHRIVADAFIGPLPKGLHTRHFDNDKSNNRASNLRYGTILDNVMDNYRAGMYRNPPITRRKRVAIRRLLSLGEAPLEVASNLGIKVGLVYRERSIFNREARKAALVTQLTN